ncbi:hypothetical protein [Thioalkalivibrio sp. HK1]|uniref:hypothetical protein n=1 Tax=Thioalkalivibrio sp. HK1 TaxID=1469245 RepID=UPI0004703E9E|nr:hypothetical protein [Thioalkalivibrio sp. HK1]
MKTKPTLVPIYPTDGIGLILTNEGPRSANSVVMIHPDASEEDKNGGISVADPRDRIEGGADEYDPTRCTQPMTINMEHAGQMGVFTLKDAGDDLIAFVPFVKWKYRQQPFLHFANEFWPLEMKPDGKTGGVLGAQSVTLLYNPDEQRLHIERNGEAFTIDRHAMLTDDDRRLIKEMIMQVGLTKGLLGTGVQRGRLNMMFEPVRTGTFDTDYRYRIDDSRSLAVPA